MANQYTMATDMQRTADALEAIGDAPATFPDYGIKTVATAGTAEALVASSTPIVAPWTAVVIRAFPGNEGIIYVGDENVTSSNGVRLGASDVDEWRVTDLDEIYIDASVTGGNEGVSWHLI